ncbi:SpaH/EbpB family LPXTG-anchored major pilin [Leifsonia aquatica]|uniref:SpaH/EbpB family LPXTG-anchored major pilin n=1 Tax=Leifsonia aquatica TaxID=144185 RepID=UPI0038287B29
MKVVISTIVNTAGGIPNQAIISPNAPSFDIQPGLPGGPVETPTPVTKFGNVTLEKVSASDNSVKLAGAQFKVNATEADTNAVSISGTSTSTTDSAGQLTISGLRQSGRYDGNAVSPGETDFQYYWIAEVEAPNGYELLAQPVRVIVGEEDSIVDFCVENSPSNGGFQLPFTGFVLSAGIFYGRGVAILAGISRRASAFVARTLQRPDLRAGCGEFDFLPAPGLFWKSVGPDVTVP